MAAILCYSDRTARRKLLWTCITIASCLVGLLSVVRTPKPPQTPFWLLQRPRASNTAKWYIYSEMIHTTAQAAGSLPAKPPTLRLLACPSTADGTRALGICRPRLEHQETCPSPHSLSTGGRHLVPRCTWAKTLQAVPAVAPTPIL